MTTALERMGREQLLHRIADLEADLLAASNLETEIEIAQETARHASRECQEHIDHVMTLHAKVAALETENARLAKNHAIMFETLTATQAVSTRLTNEARGVRHFLNSEGSPRLVIALHAIMGAAYAAECKHGPFAPRLTRIPDGTGGDHLAKLRDAFQRECSEAEANGTVSWGLLASEEFFEAMAEQDPIALRGEVAQLGAVCAAWIRAIDERGAK